MDEPHQRAVVVNALKKARSALAYADTFIDDNDFFVHNAWADVVSALVALGEEEDDTWTRDHECH